MENFTPLSGFIGGFLIGGAAIALLYFNGQICGISGIFSSVLPPAERNSDWKKFFVLGLLVGGVGLSLFYPTAYDFVIEQSAPLVLLGGFLVGFGSRLGKGCTSGHGICGIGREAGRSFVATAIFFITGLITASTIFLLRG